MLSSEENCIKALTMPKDTQIELVKFVAILRSPTTEKNKIPSEGDLFGAIGTRFDQILSVQSFSVKNRAGVFITFASNKARNNFTSYLRSVPRHDELYPLRDMNRTIEIHVFLELYLVPDTLIAIMKASGIKIDADDNDAEEPISSNHLPSRKASGSSRECYGLEKPPLFHLEQDTPSMAKVLVPPCRPPAVHHIVFAPMNDNRIRSAGGVVPPSPLLTLTPNAEHRLVPTEPRADRRFTGPEDAPSGKKSSPSLLDRMGPPSPELLSAYPTLPGNPVSARATKGTTTIVQFQGNTPPTLLDTEKDASEAHTTSRKRTDADSTPIQHAPLPSPIRTNDESRCRPNPPDPPRLLNFSERDDISRPARRSTDGGSPSDTHMASIHGNIGQELSNVPLESETRLREVDDELHSIETLLSETREKLVTSEKQVEAERSSKMEVQTQLFKVRVELKAWKLNAARTDEARRQAGLNRQCTMVDASVQTNKEMDGGSGAIAERQSISSKRAERTKAEDDDECERQRPHLHRDTPDKRKEIEELESGRMKLQTDLELQESLYEGLLEIKNHELRWARFDKGKHEVELKRQRVSYEEQLKELRDELLAQNVDLLTAKFPDTSRALIHAFVLTANLGKRKRK